jgi:hypothetical protein
VGLPRCARSRCRRTLAQLLDAAPRGLRGARYRDSLSRCAVVVRRAGRFAQAHRAGRAIHAEIGALSKLDGRALDVYTGNGGSGSCSRLRVRATLVEAFAPAAVRPRAPRATGLDARRGAHRERRRRGSATRRGGRALRRGDREPAASRRGAPVREGSPCDGPLVYVSCEPRRWRDLALGQLGWFMGEWCRST